MPTPMPPTPALTQDEVTLIGSLVPVRPAPEPVPDVPPPMTGRLGSTGRVGAVGPPSGDLDGRTLVDGAGTCPPGLLRVGVEPGTIAVRGVVTPGATLTVRPGTVRGVCPEPDGVMLRVGVGWLP